MHDLHSLDTGAAKSAEEKKRLNTHVQIHSIQHLPPPSHGSIVYKGRVLLQSSSSLNSHLQCVSSKEWEKNQAIKLLNMCLEKFGNLGPEGRDTLTCRKLYSLSLDTNF